MPIEKRNVKKTVPHTPYISIRQYLLERHWEEIFTTFRDRLEAGEVFVNRRTPGGRNPRTYRLQKYEIKRVESENLDADSFLTDIIIVTDIDISARDDDDVLDSGTAHQWFRVSVVFSLNTASSKVEYLSESIYNDKERPIKEPLDEYLIPYLEKQSFDAAAEEILEQYYPEALLEPMLVNGAVLAERLGLSVQPMRLTEDGSVLGKLFLYSGETQVYNENDHSYVNVRIDRNTILYDPTAIENTTGATLNGTLVHECVHKVKHFWFQLLQHTVDARAASIVCPSRMPEAITALTKPLMMLEWQAKQIGLRVQLAASSVRKKTEEMLAKNKQNAFYDKQAYLFGRIIEDLALFFGVSKQIMRHRLIDLGYGEVQGVLNYANNAYSPVHIFRRGTCGKHQTFTIGAADAVKAYRNNEVFRRVLETGRFVYTDGHFCLDQPKYVQHTPSGKVSMTLYAREHIDECCLVFTVRSIAKKILYYEHGVLHHDAYKTERAIEIAESDVRELEKQAREMDNRAQGASQILQQLPALFRDTLVAHMKRQAITNDILAERLGLSARIVSDLRNDVKPTLDTPGAVALCLALNLEPVLSFDLLRKAGIQLTVSKEDTFYHIMLSSMYTRSVYDCNEILKVVGLRPLTKGKNVA